MMSIGHDGDRVVDRNGMPHAGDVSDAALDALIVRGTRLCECPGVYGASSRVLDGLVDAALEGGALGASLTGAGIAGSVLALCRAEDASAVAGHVRESMRGEDYQKRANLAERLSEEQLKEAVVVNAATRRAGELRLD